MYVCVARARVCVCLCVCVCICVPAYLPPVGGGLLRSARYSLLFFLKCFKAFIQDIDPPARVRGLPRMPLFLQVFDEIMRETRRIYEQAQVCGQ